MDLGYSSSDSDSEATAPVKRAAVETVDVKDIFSVKHQPSAKRHKREAIDMANIMSKVLNEETYDEEDETESKGDHKEEDKAGENELPSSVPKNTVINEFNMSSFYNENQKLRESGKFDSFKQDNIGKIELRTGAGGIGSLKDVINFNLKNEEKILYQNKERIAREYLNKKKV